LTKQLSFFSSVSSIFILAYFTYNVLYFLRFELWGKDGGKKKIVFTGLGLSIWRKWISI